MVRRAHEPEGNLILTGDTNKQDFPARVTDDAAQSDNRKRIQAAKEADLERQTTAAQREAAGGKQVTLTSEAGTKVSAPSGSADALKRMGFGK